MPYPLIILGAGASADYVDPSLRSGMQMPPVTDELVKVEFLDDELSSEYTEVQSLISTIAPTVISEKKSLEKYLGEYVTEAKDNKNRRVQLRAFTFYLQGLFEKISASCRPYNNYKVLVDYLGKYCEGKACITTFNYDTLLERSYLPLLKYESMTDYVSGDMPLIKLHGSHNWSYIKLRDSVETDTRYANSFEFFKEYEGNFGEPYHEKELREHRNSHFFVPSISIPATQKPDFVCPKSHINKMVAAMGVVDRVLVIGWRAGDKELIEYMGTFIKQGTPITIVSGSLDSAQKVENKFKNVGDFDTRTFGGGFSQFISDEDNVAKFFS